MVDSHRGNLCNLLPAHVINSCYFISDLGFVDPIVPTCAPLHGCSIDCLGGLAVDENHCHICQCRDGEMIYIPYTTIIIVTYI